MNDILYRGIIECEDAVRHLDKSALTSGVTLLCKLFDNVEEQTRFAKYVCDAYDVNSPIIGKHKTRQDEKLASAKKHGIKVNGKWQNIVSNLNSDANEYISWYYKQIKNIEFEAIITGEELVEYLLEVSRERIDKERDGIQMGDDKLLKAMELKSKCFENAVSHMSLIAKLRVEFNKKYEIMDENVKREAVKEKIIKNSGTGEQIAHLAKEISSK